MCVLITFSQLEDLLDLKQKQANVSEARIARISGNTITVFTVVTIIFLPASFMVAFLALPIAEYPKSDSNYKLSYVIKYTSTSLLSSTTLLQTGPDLRSDNHGRNGHTICYTRPICQPSPSPNRSVHANSPELLKAGNIFQPQGHEIIESCRQRLLQVELANLHPSWRLFSSIGLLRQAATLSIHTLASIAEVVSRIQTNEECDYG